MEIVDPPGRGRRMSPQPRRQQASTGQMLERLRQRPKTVEHQSGGVDTVLRRALHAREQAMNRLEQEVTDIRALLEDKEAQLRRKLEEAEDFRSQIDQREKARKEQRRRDAVIEGLKSEDRTSS